MSHIEQLDRFLNLWLLVAPIILIPALIVFVYWLHNFLIAYSRQNWKRLLSVILAPIAVYIVCSVFSKNGINADWVHFQIKKSSYEETVKNLTMPSPKTYTWDWGDIGGAATANIFYTLTYEENDALLKEQSGTDFSNIRNVRSFGNHFYLITDTYQ